ncbi:U3 small nucleolar RNA-associated protein 6-domain-containing protein [Cyathus striatus]|nr:U3 small nucleolar RNA-associated protein 6-domain-containing protein [Cyathus striatus]
MERVQFQQEQMLQELKDLVDKKLFTQKETKQIMKKRTSFETALVRRVAKKSDFLRYAAYEMGLEQLRRKRVERMKLPSAPPSISDFALVRRQFQIFERALRRFKSDVGLWMQYIQLAKREGARALVGRITARALQLHPNKPALYILAASHELNHLSPAAARALLQRGIRLNADSIEIWREYVRMELGFIENLRRRWDVLGINSNVEKGKQKALEDDPSQYLEADVTTIENTVDEEDSGIEAEDGAKARRQIMEGAIVKSVITSAAHALPRINLFEQLKRVISDYPSPHSLKTSLLDHLYDTLRTTLPNDPKALKLLAGRFLSPGLNREEFIDGLQKANQEMLDQVGDASREDVLAAYAEFVEQWCGNAIDDNLKLYLITSLQSVIQRAKASPSLLSTHVRLSIDLGDNISAVPAKLLKMARKYSERCPTSPVKASGEVSKAWAQARKSIQGSERETLQIWTWGLQDVEPAAGRVKLHERLLKESMVDSSLSGVHEELLIGYVNSMHEAIKEPVSGTMSDQEAVWSARWVDGIRHMASKYLTTGRVWREVFRVTEETGNEDDEQGRILEEVYEMWRREEGVEATVEWARWLLGHGKGREGSEVVMRARSWMSETERGEVERGWKAVLDEA